MGKIQGALLHAVRSLLAGCGGGAVPTGELTGPDVRTREMRSQDGTSAWFKYRLERETADKYVIRGNALFQGVGRVRQGRMKLYLVRDKEVVATVPLRVRVTHINQKIHYYRQFKAAEPFDSVDFGWRLKYRL
jgi:hypothetical protein